MLLVCLLLAASLPLLTPLMLLASLLLLLFCDDPGMSAVGGISSIANTFDVASVPAVVACP
jgi:hypothetical protein